MNRLKILLVDKIHSVRVSRVSKVFKNSLDRILMEADHLEVAEDLGIFLKSLKNCLVAGIPEDVVDHSQLNKKEAISQLTSKLTLWKLLRALKKLFNTLELTLVQHVKERNQSLAHNLKPVGDVVVKVFKQ